MTEGGKNYKLDELIGYYLIYLHYIIIPTNPNLSFSPLPTDKIEKHINKRQKPHHYYGEAFLRIQSEIIFELKIYELIFINQLRIINLKIKKSILLQGYDLWF